MLLNALKCHIHKALFIFYKTFCPSFITLFALLTQAIKFDDSNAVFYSNRSAAYSSKEFYESALKDADKAIELRPGAITLNVPSLRLLPLLLLPLLFSCNLVSPPIHHLPEWNKGYARKGAALHGSQKFDDSITAYEEGLKVCPGDAMIQRGLDQVVADSEAEYAATMGGGGIDIKYVTSLSHVFVVSTREHSSHLFSPLLLMLPYPALYTLLYLAPHIDITYQLKSICFNCFAFEL